MAPTSNTTTSTSTDSKASSSDTSTTIHLSSNFAAKGHISSPTENHGSIGYDHEIYLQLMAGDSQTAEKTPNQIYREERARHRKSRSLDPAISDPQGDPGPIDFECAEISQLKRESQSGSGRA
ncbi:hypothetical protein PHISCL_03999 [Aspergillus sclerotialis]|uniref:Uncharacterized protein n=1 Tax=Aspergillus sclerotialis TaxID=2070753 RepID=A0A3A2ZN25_9EURO|nr:hypothetical protein PHISCL_03999 [Aspergillus sclerotialis]